MHNSFRGLMHPILSYRFNVLNLNRQLKLYQQGLTPMVKIGGRGNWERLRTRAEYEVCIKGKNAHGIVVHL